MRNERERLLEILKAIESIEKYAEEGKDAFEADELIQTWIVHHITIIANRYYYAWRGSPDSAKFILQRFYNPVIPT